MFFISLFFYVKIIMKVIIDKKCGRLGIYNGTPYTEDYKEWLEVKKGKILYQDIHNIIWLY